MATWGTEIQKAGNRISDAWNNVVRGGGDAFNSIKRNISEVGSFFKNGGTSVVGLNVGEIPNMKTAIENYCTEIETAVKKLESYNPEVAFKGTSIVPALKDYILAVEEACVAIVSNMRAFEDQLDEVQKAWESKDLANSKIISGSAESARSEYKTYSSPNAGSSAS